MEHFLYSYDPVGNRIQTERVTDGNDEDDLDGNEKESLITQYAHDAHDALNQLTEVQTYNQADISSLSTTKYSYDPVGNRLSKEMAWGELLESEQYTYDRRENLTSVIGAIRGDIGELLINSMYADQSITDSVYEPDTVTSSVYGTMFDPQDLEPELLEQYKWGSDNRLQQVTNQWGDRSRFSYDGDGNRIKMTVDVAHGPNGRGNGNGPDNGNGQFKCGHVVPPGFVPPGLAKKCGPGEEPYPDEHPGGPRDGWESQHKKKHWEFHYTNDISLALPEVLQVTEDDATKWKESFVYGAGMERISMTYLPAYDHDNGWEPTPGAGGADLDVTPKTLYYMTDIMGSTIGLLTQDGRLSARYHYDEFGMVLDSKKFDVNWPGPDNLYGYTGLEYDYYTDLNYARARYYKPEIGRFISEDTYKGDIGNPQSQNGYAYVHNNPLRYIDPTGNIKFQIGGLSLKPEFHFDSDFTYDPNAKATFSDRANWAKWGVFQKGAYLKIGKEAARSYGHYRSGSGETLEINYNKVYKEDKIIRENIDAAIVLAQKSAEGYFENGNGASFEMISDLIGIPNGSSENWQKTIGAHYVYAHSQLSINQQTGMATMVITFSMEDIYNFNKGMSDIAPGTPDNVNGRFAELGWAKEFLTIGSLTRTVTWSVGNINGSSTVSGGGSGR